MQTNSESTTPARRTRARNYIAWGFTISLAVHVLGGGYLQQFAVRPPLSIKPGAPDLYIVHHPRMPSPHIVPTHPVPPLHAGAHRVQPHPAHIAHHDAHSHIIAQTSLPPGVTPSTEGSGSGTFPGPSGVGGPGTGEPLTTAVPPTELRPAPACSIPAQEARTISKVQADYPDRAAGVSGEAQVVVSLDERGNVTGVAIHKSSGNVYLDQAAMNAARSASYAPEIRDCERVAGSYLFVANFAAQ